MGTHCFFPPLPSLPAPSNILLCTRAFPKSLEIRETSCQSLLPVSPCSLHPDDRGRSNRIPGCPPTFSQTQGRPVPACQLIPMPFFATFLKAQCFPCLLCSQNISSLCGTRASAPGAIGLTRHSYTRCLRIFFVGHICKVVYLSSHSARSWLQTVVEMGRLALAACGGTAAML